MAAYFFDSSALVKRYHPEVGTADVNRLFSEQHSRHFIARLAVVEVQSALVRKVREGLISLTDLDIVRQRFLEEITQRRLQVVRMTDLHYRTAERLIRHYGPQPGQPRLRTLDALQLAVALNRTTEDWHTNAVTLSVTKGLGMRFFATLRMTRPSGHIVKCTNVMWSDLELHQQTQLNFFVSADENQCSAAKAEQLVVLNPTQP